MMLEVILGLLLVFSLWINYNLYNNLSVFELNYIEIEDAKLNDEVFILELRKRLMSYRLQLRQMDTIRAFESDDELSFFFKELDQMVEEMSNYFDITDDVSSDIAKLSVTNRSNYSEKN